MPGQLETYQRKRDFRKTPEPKGRRGKRGERLAYVVQKHDATRLHYDLRLEHDGVLKSWAVPKEPSYNPKDRRLAVQTEDHPLEYGSFEGEIPEPEYGAGTVVIWDRGYWEPLGDPERGLSDGKLDFELHGDRLRGRWTLVRMAKRDARKDNWLLIKRTDAAARGPDDAASQSKRPARTTSSARKNGAAAVAASRMKGARRVELPRKLEPQLATLVAAPPEGDGWIYEPKLDGYRLLCRIERGNAELITRRGNDWTERFPHVAEAAAALPCKSAVLDGEAVVFDARGISSFQRLQNAIAGRDAAIVLVAFDLLYLDGWDLRGAALLERKAALAQLLEGAPPQLRYGEHVTESGSAFFREACALGLEGIIAKRADDPYRDGRTRSWLKIKCLQRQEFAIVGYTDPAGSRTGFGALLLGVRDEPGGPLRYAGKVGTGFNERELRTLLKKLEPLRRRSPPVDAASARAAGRAAHWVEPELAAEISFGEWTSDGRLRQPVFHGLREDKPGAEITVERPAPLPASAKKAPISKKASARAPKEPAASPQRPQAVARVRLTSPGKVLFPDPGITKRELAAYWQAVAEYALPLMRDRPLTLFRCPEGYGKQCFYQKHVGVGVPSVVARVSVTEGEEPYAMVDGLPALLGLVQISALELHVWGSRAQHLDQPDIIVFDLDPAEDVPWGEVVAAAGLVRERLEALALRSFLRVTGGKGLHVVVPVEPGPTWPSVKKFARTLVNEVVADEPKRFTASMAKNKRGGKIFIDYLRNDREATAIAAYSPRARPGAPVALPIAWEELDSRASSPPKFPLRDVPALLRKRKADPWAEFDAARRPLV